MEKMVEIRPYFPYFCQILPWKFQNRPYSAHIFRKKIPIFPIFFQKNNWVACMETDRAFFLKKNLVSYKKIQTCIFRCFFDHFSLTMLTILLKSSEMVEWKVRNNSWKFQVREKSGTHFFGAVSKLSFLSPNSKKNSKSPNGSIRENKWFLAIIFFPTQWVTRLPDLVTGWICFILHILIVLIVLPHLTTSNYLTWGQNYAKRGQLCRKKGENLDFRLFFEFECLNMLISPL